MTWIDDAVNSAARQQGNAVEDYLKAACDVLGLTPEELADAWVLEEHPDEIVPFDSTATSIRFTTRYRLRPKTDADRVAPESPDSSIEEK